RAERPAIASRGGEALEHNRIAAAGRPTLDVGQPDALERSGEAAAPERRVAPHPRRTECAGDPRLHGGAAGGARAAGATERIGEAGPQIDPPPGGQATPRADGQGPSDAHLCSAPGRDTPVDTGSTVAQVPACLCVDRLQTSLAGLGRDKTGD